AYCEKGIIKTVCDVPVRDAMRGGVDIKTKQLDGDEIEQLKNLRPMGIPHSVLFENVFARTYDVIKLEDDKEHIRMAYLDRGYFKAKVGDETVKIVRRGGSGWRLPLVRMNMPGIYADVTVRVEEGQEFRLRNITFQGINLFKTPEA